MPCSRKPAPRSTIHKIDETKNWNKLAIIINQKGKKYNAAHCDQVTMMAHAQLKELFHGPLRVKLSSFDMAALMARCAAAAAKASESHT
jgi:hypothetical protein